MQPRLTQLHVAMHNHYAWPISKCNKVVLSAMCSGFSALIVPSVAARLAHFKFGVRMGSAIDSTLTIRINHNQVSITFLFDVVTVDASLRTETYTEGMLLGDPRANACSFRLGRCMPALIMLSHQHI